MKKWQYSACSISKYNPMCRNENHVYLKDEWTSIADVGRTYDSKLFTMSEYMEIEQKYIDAITIIMDLNNCDKLYVRKLEKHEAGAYFEEEVNKELYPYYLSLKNKLEVPLPAMPYMLKIMLRELSWCELVNLEKKLYVRFGYDYYMSVNTKISKEIVKEKVELLGLFVR